MAELVSTTTPPPPAPLAPANPLEQLRGLARQPAVRRALPWFGGLAGLGAVALTWAALAPAPQRTLYAGLDDAGRAAVTASLDKAGIAWRIDADTGAPGQRLTAQFQHNALIIRRSICHQGHPPGVMVQKRD